jgi:6-phosphogluconolactonase
VNSSPEIRVFAAPQELFQAAAQQFVELANESIRNRGRFVVALSGGSTPKGLYALLAEKFASAVDWKKAFFVWGDERHVPPDHPESNFRMAHEAMLSKLPIPAENVFRVRAEEADANRAAEGYERTLKQFFQLQPDEFPRCDLIHLGMGPDGHTASLFPGTQALREKTRWVVANWVEKFQTFRITLTLPVLNNARYVTFFVTGAEKATPLREVLEGSAPGEQFPSKLVAPVNGKVVWMVDRAAAEALSAPLADKSKI